MSDIFPNCKVRHDYIIESDNDACQRLLGISDTDFRDNGVSIENYLALGNRVVLILDNKHTIGIYLDEETPLRIGFELRNESFGFLNPYVFVPQTKQANVCISIKDTIMKYILNDSSNPIRSRNNIYFQKQQKQGNHDVFFIQPNGTEEGNQTSIGYHYTLRKGMPPHRDTFTGLNDGIEYETDPSLVFTYRTTRSLNFADYMKRQQDQQDQQQQQDQQDLNSWKGQGLKLEDLYDTQKNKQNNLNQNQNIQQKKRKLENYLNSNLQKKSRINITDSSSFVVSVTPPDNVQARNCRVFKIYKTLFCFRFLRFLFNIYQSQNINTFSSQNMDTSPMPVLLRTNQIVEIFNKSSSYKELSKFLKNGKEFSKFLKNDQIFLLISK